MALARLLTHVLRVVLLSALLAASAVAARGGESESRLRSPEGPYRGRVLDAISGQPVPDALVVILWQRGDEAVKGVRHLVAADETLTNAAGQFVLDVSAREQRLAGAVFVPRIIIFKPGYATHPPLGEAVPGTPASRFAGGGALVRLTPVTTFEERSESFNDVLTLLTQAQLFPGDELPLARDLMRSELKDLVSMGTETETDSERKPPSTPLARPGISGCPSVPPYRDTEVWDSKLKGHHGPYRGRVIDTETKAPLAGAVVVALWLRHKIYPVQAVTKHYAVREALTDANGEWTIHADDIECNAPRHTFRPTFTIFLSGYGSFPRQQAAPTGFIGGIFEGAGAVVELQRLTSAKARRDHLLKLSPYSLAEAPFKEIPEFVRLFNEERASLGLRPYSPVGD